MKINKLYWIYDIKQIQKNIMSKPKKRILVSMVFTSFSHPTLQMQSWADDNISFNEEKICSNAFRHIKWEIYLRCISFHLFALLRQLDSKRFLWQIIVFCVVQSSLSRNSHSVNALVFLRPFASSFSIYIVNAKKPYLLQSMWRKSNVSNARFVYALFASALLQTNESEWKESQKNGKRNIFIINAPSFGSSTQTKIHGPYYIILRGRRCN